ncbi:hypothetical protein ACHAWF_018080 [Thalassiosira exigua]
MANDREDVDDDLRHRERRSRSGRRGLGGGGPSSPIRRRREEGEPSSSRRRRRSPKAEEGGGGMTTELWTNLSPLRSAGSSKKKKKKKKRVQNKSATASASRPCEADRNAQEHPEPTTTDGEATQTPSPSGNRFGKGLFDRLILLAFVVEVFIWHRDLLRPKVDEASKRSSKRSPPPSQTARKFYLENEEGKSSIRARDVPPSSKRKFAAKEEAPSTPSRHSLRTPLPNRTAAASDSPKHLTGSNAPLFYHISPGSTGSRTLYHASCTAGFPSVHHKSFCISPANGVGRVDPSAIRGARAHTEVLRLYTMAYRCTRDRVRAQKAKIKELCETPVDEWAGDLRRRLGDVMGSSVVGLFDTPYPFLAPQVLEMAGELRPNTVVAMTERDPEEWAWSRGTKHPLLLCREEYSDDFAGASEFDIIGCVDRARADHPEETLRFWDVFEYRAKNETDDLESFLGGMERQMERHQERYRPLAEYAPDMFGDTGMPVAEKDVVRDIRSHMFGTEAADRDVKGMRMRRAWQDRYAVPLTDRGRFEWTMADDTIRVHTKKAEFAVEHH